MPSQEDDRYRKTAYNRPQIMNPEQHHNFIPQRSMVNDNRVYTHNKTNSRDNRFTSFHQGSSLQHHPFEDSKEPANNFCQNYFNYELGNHMHEDDVPLRIKSDRGTSDRIDLSNYIKTNSNN